MREIQWLKRIMNELGDDRESTKDRDAGNQREAAHSAVDVDDEDDSELDCLLRRAMLLLRAKADPTGSARGVEAAEPEEDEGDDELDQLLQRALMLLRQRDEQGSKVTTVEATSEQDEDDDELDRLLRRAMLLFAERRRLSAPSSGVTGAVKASATVAGTPGSPSMTDGEDDGEDDEEDDELKGLLRRAMGLLRRRLRVLANNQEPDEELDVSTPLAKAAAPMDWRKALCLQQLDKLQRKQTKKILGAQKRQRDEKQEGLTDRKTKRARCLHELQQDADVVVVHAEAKPNPVSAAEAHTEENLAAMTNAERTAETDATMETAIGKQQPQEPASVDPISSLSLSAGRPCLVGAVQQTSRDEARDLQLLTLRASNAKLSEENTALKLQLEDRASDARMVLLLQEQVQRLQQRELELMRALARCSGGNPSG